ncbi:MAG TPA: tetratricopeptide repeat protein [candidate division WOR-3 bacterium]|uniref:Tetratricopeptide repeat protein n=1 Tax=candidate division WOR-3 bacterium TaxID=2052148 RepID=A0A7V0T4U3_UNCW3|nr:tetratricopeptide repeat protein [candidate division WOR-3 bacterium]
MTEQSVVDLSAVRLELNSIADADERMQATLRASDELCRVDADAARVFLQELCEAAESHGAHSFLSRALARLANICRQAGDLDEADGLAGRAVEAARLSGERRWEAAALHVAGLVHHDRGEYVRANECYEHCLEASLESGYVEGELAALNQRAILLGLQGRPAQALACYERCLAVDIERGSRDGEVVSRVNVGWMLEQFGRWEEATEQFYRAIAICEQEGFEDWRMLASCNLGELFIKRRRLEQAVALFASIVEAESSCVPKRTMLGIALTHLGQAMAARGDTAAAMASYERAIDVLGALGDKQELVRVLWLRAELSLETGQLEKAEEYLGRAAETAARSGLSRELAETIRVRGRLFVETGDQEAARDCFERALGEFAETPESYEAARVCLQFGRFLVACGEPVRARALLRQAVGTFRRLSVVEESEEANRQLLLLEGPEQGAGAVLAGIQGLERVKPEPAAFVKEALRLLHTGLGCVGAVLLCDGKMLVSASDGRTESGEDAEDCPHHDLAIACDGGERIVLRLSGLTREAVAAYSVVLNAVARLLAVPVGRLVDARSTSRERPDLEGLVYTGVVGRNEAMLKNLEIVAKVADAGVPVLVQGESGTGKELVARALHESSKRRTKPFCAINCAAVPEGLLEAEFFGVARGAATGVAARKGKFELASGGTVFLDEIGDMSPGLQAKLLRVLQENEFEPVGGNRTVKADVRVVAATNQDVGRLIRDGGFRADLYYRLNVVEIVLPPLRERREDLVELVRHFVRASSREFGRRVVDVSEETLAALMVHDWPGNIRELQHVIERAVILCRESALSVEELPVGIRPRSLERASGGSPVRQARQEARQRAESEVEKAMLLDCLEQCGWNVKSAAERAGFSRAQFYRLLRRHDISRPR